MSSSYNVHNLEDVNNTLAVYNDESDKYTLSPLLGNVCFSSGMYGFSFTLNSFAQLYHDHYGGGFPPKELARRLWGDMYFMSTRRTFVKKPPHPNAQRTFVEFILEPLYKIFSQVRCQLLYTIRSGGLVVLTIRNLS